MKNFKLKSILMVAIVSLLTSCGDDEGSVTQLPTATESELLLASIAADGGVPFNASNPAVTYSADQNVFMPSALGIDLRTDINVVAAGPTVRMPLFRGWETLPDGSNRLAGYIITEASDQAMATALGVVFSPRMAAGSDAGIQDATWNDSDGVARLVFEGYVDFSPTRSLVAGPMGDGLTGFPPASATPGAVASDNWSSYVRLPSGVVLNAQLMANSSGIHDRIPDSVGNRGVSVQDDLNNPNLSYSRASVVLQLLDGWHAGRPYYFHLVTDTSDPGPATIEKGVYAPRLARIPGFGVFPNGALLGFSPTANGNRTPNAQGQLQGLNNTILSVDQDQDPINTFPIDPTDTRYSPMWDAHISEYTTPEASRGILTSIPVVQGLVNDGTLIPFRGNLSGPVNPFIAGLTPTGAIINCPVICQPFPAAIGTQTGAPRN